MGARDDAATATLRALPAVHELAAALPAPHSLAVTAARRAIDEERDRRLAGRAPRADLESRACELLARLSRPSMRRVINATGVILHTNLGRAPLSVPARDAVARTAEGYANLELDLETGERGSRQTHVEALLVELTEAESAMVVNNGAAAVLLAVAALAGPGHAVVVSRGQLVEIGGGFRIPEVIATSGATLVEVGTTNRTRVRDYERAVSSSGRPVSAILRVHPSNFRTLGFVEDVSVEALCGLGVPVIDDVGSGVLSGGDSLPALAGEPSLRDSVIAGAALVCCSGDKLLGGPQAGLLVGQRSAVAAARAHPLARAVRIDKLSLAALEATLMLYRDPRRAFDELPVLQMLTASEETLRAKAARLGQGIGAPAQVIGAASKVGGGALPLLELEGPVVAIAGGADPGVLARALRQADPPIIARVHDGQVLLDPRTVTDEEIELVATATRAALACLRSG